MRAFWIYSCRCDWGIGFLEYMATLRKAQIRTMLHHRCIKKLVTKFRIFLGFFQTWIEKYFREYCANLNKGPKRIKSEIVRQFSRMRSHIIWLAFRRYWVFPCSGKKCDCNYELLAKGLKVNELMQQCNSTILQPSPGYWCRSSVQQSAARKGPAASESWSLNVIPPTVRPEFLVLCQLIN
jgi:hypothetical protein